ncbi:hypothetical protein Ancab_027013 [Ancistrocladus abbreviatus]
MSSLNAIAVEAYKEYTLVSLIHHGLFSTSFPKYTSSMAQRNLKNFTQEAIFSTSGISFDLAYAALTLEGLFQLKMTHVGEAMIPN